MADAIPPACRVSRGQEASFRIDAIEKDSRPLFLFRAEGADRIHV